MWSTNDVERHLRAEQELLGFLVAGIKRADALLSRISNMVTCAEVGCLREDQLDSSKKHDLYEWIRWWRPTTIVIVCIIPDCPLTMSTQVTWILAGATIRQKTIWGYIFVAWFEEPRIETSVDWSEVRLVWMVKTTIISEVNGQSFGFRSENH